MQILEVIPSREFNLLYILLDICFLLFLAVLLIYKKRYMTLLFGFCGGILYFIVDYGIFYMLLDTRSVNGANPLWFLLWLSMSYGFTNFVFIWIWLDHDRNIIEWSLLIVIGWFAVALLAQNFGSAFAQISIYRGTNGYHGVMALILFVGYAILFIGNIKNGDKKFPILYLLAIGILVQFSWEAVLLITGIRAQGLGPIIVNSLLETNLGIPYLFFIHQALSKRYYENLRKKKISIVKMPQKEFVLDENSTI